MVSCIGCIPENQWLQTISEGWCSNDQEDSGLRAEYC